MPGEPRETSKLVRTSILGFDLVEFTGHALEQMDVRGVTQDEALRAIGNPNQTGLPTPPGRQRVRWNKNQRVAVDVVYEALKDRVRIVTVIKVTRRLVERRR